MRKILLLFVVLFSAAFLYGEEIVLTISDFKVESTNPAHKFIGKGLSRLVAGELRKAPQIKLLEREQINKILDEQELSISDLTDHSMQREIGMLLAADYIVFGEIIDMGDSLLLSLRMVDVTTGEIAWQGDLTEKLGTYDYIAAYFAQLILEELGAEVKSSTIAKVENKEEKDEEAIIVLSEGIDSFDKGDTEQAKVKLEQAKKIDPKNEVANYFLSKLIVNTSKFKTITEQYYPVQNPAYLGIIQYDKFFISGGFSKILGGNEDSWVPIDEYPDLVMREGDGRVSAGYQFPLGENMGLGISTITYRTQDEIHDPVELPTDTSKRNGYGGIISFGWAPADMFSLGIGVSLYAQLRNGWVADPDEEGTIEYNDPPYFRQAFCGGFLIKTPDSGIIFDFLGGYSFEQFLYFDPETFPNTRDQGIERSAPVFLENTFTFSLLQKKLFIILKQLNDIYLETGFYYGRVIPAVEYWITNSFSVRAGMEGTMMSLEETTNYGLGGTGGFSIRIIKLGLDIDTNVTYRKRASRFIDGQFIEELIPLITISKVKTYITR